MPDLALHASVSVLIFYVITSLLGSANGFRLTVILISLKETYDYFFPAKHDSSLEEFIAGLVVVSILYLAEKLNDMRS